MALSNFIRGAGRAAASVGRAVQSASQKLDQSVAPQTASMPELAVPPTTAPAAAPSTGFQLPDLGPGPDASAPEFQGAEGQKKLAAAQTDYQHKQDIHQAFMDLDKTFTQVNPTRDYEKEYREQVAMQQAHEKERPRGSNLARAALALGDFNPAVQQSGRSNLDTYNAGIEKQGVASDKSFAQRMVLRQKMHEQAASDAEAEGNWKKALAENEKAALMKADTEGLAHKYKMEEQAAVQAATTERAKIRRAAMENSAKIRAGAIASAHGLTGTFMTTFEKEAAKAVAKLLGPRDLTKDYDPADLDSITTYLEHLAEMIHDQQQGTEDGGANFLKTHPGKRPQPKSSVKEKF